MPWSRACRAIALLVVIGLAAAPAAAEEGSPTVTVLGGYEAAALHTALELRGLTVDTAPAGKTIERVHVVNLDVFGDDVSWMRWANIFHVTTKERVVARELLLGPGEPWNPDKVEESRRLLSDELFSALVVIVPVASSSPGRVDLLVVTRDIWSLRLNSRYEFQDGTLSELSLSLSENNLLGLRKQVAFVFDMDLGSFTLGPQYVDKNIGGTRLTLLGKWGAVFSRETGEFEGTQSYTAFGYPLFSLDRKWGASIVERHFDGVNRFFCGAELLDFRNVGRRDPVTDDPVPCNAPHPDGGQPLLSEFALRTFSLESSVVRQLGDRVKHRIYFGHDLSVVRPRLLDDFAGDAAQAEAFVGGLFPRSERASAAFVRYTLFTPHYVVYRNLASFDLAEDVRLGPELDLRVSVGREELGSEVNFVSAGAETAWTFGLADDGYLRLWSGASVRRAHRESTDRVVSSTITAASPSVADLRLVTRLTASGRFRDTNNTFFAVGGTSGLRGYPIQFFRGDRSMVGNFEIRSLPRRLWFSRVGGVLFWDVGHAAQTFEQIALHHDVGIGLRSLIPHFQPYVFRFDWAIPLNGESAGFPGRITAGVQQAF